MGVVKSEPGQVVKQREGREEGPPAEKKEEKRVGVMMEWRPDQESILNSSRNTYKLGGRLLQFVDRWDMTCGGSSLIKRGFEILWVTERGKEWIEYFGPKRKECWQRGEMREGMRQAVKEGLEKGIIREIPWYEVKLSSMSHVVPKSKGGYRQVLDLRLLNQFTRDISFKMEDTILLIQTARQGDFATSIDIKSAFNHIPTNPSAYSFLTFFFDGSAYTWLGMPFGAKHAPLVFTKVMRVVLGFIRKNWNVRCIGYMDDLLFLHQNKDELREITKEIGRYLEWIGWVLSTEKCEMEPSQNIVFLGWKWDFQRMELQMKKERRKILLETTLRWIVKCRRVSKVRNRDLASLMGKLNFLRTQFPRIGLYMVAMNRAKVQGVKKEGWNGYVRVTFAQEGELRVINRWICRNSPRQFQPLTPTATLTTDACKEGWGATLVTMTEKLLYHGEFGRMEEQLTSSNQRETAAVLLALRACKKKLEEERTRCVCIESDNTTTVSNLGRKRAAKSMLKMVRKIFLLAERLQMEVTAKYRPGVENQVADSLSRLEGAGDYYLKQKVFELGLEKLREVGEEIQDVVEVDMFATEQNTRLPRFVSPSPNPKAEASDAFSISWRGIKVYAHPPIRMISRTLLKIELERVRTVLVIPNWPTQAWWPRLRQLVTKEVLLGEAEEILEMGKMMKQRGTKLPPGKLMMIKISWN
jgi:ribonuclease HI